MSKYYHNTFENIVKHVNLYDKFNTHNLIKGIYGHAIYFFNGFSEIKGTSEVVINLIKADLGFKEYHVMLYSDNTKPIFFTEKYKFVKFNDLKFNIKNQIGLAIQDINPTGFNEMLEQIGATMYDKINFVPSYKFKDINTNPFDLIREGEMLDDLLDKVISCLPDEPEISSHSTAIRTTDTNNSISSGVGDLNGSTITIADHSGSNFSIINSDGNFNVSSGTTRIDSISENKILMSDGTSEVKWVDPPEELHGMKVLSKKSKKKKNIVSIEEDKLIIL